MSEEDQPINKTPKKQEPTREELLIKNNPDREPIGHFTGRCGYCGSKHLWDDAAAYGCDDCGAFWCY